jgi:heat-inducible transcriptional repressor
VPTTREFSLTRRNRDILGAIVKSYIATGQPVGSRTLSERSKERLSPASIRNVMAQLEAHGYLTHPHTSAGRLPTEKAFREYVQHVVASRLAPGETGFIHSSLEQATTLEQRLGKSSHVLATLTQQMGVTMVAPLSQAVLEHVQFLQLSEQRILVTLVVRGDVVRQRVIRLEESISPAELERLTSYINQQFVGWRLEAARAEILRRIREERAEFDAILRRLRLLCLRGFLAADADTQIFLEGAPNLVGGVESLDGGRVRQLLRALEDKEKLIRVLDECLRGELAVTADAAGGERLSVRIGLENAYPGLKDYALIGAVCEMKPAVPVRIAVIGPTRMPYERVISTVAHVVRMFRHLADLN